MVEPLSDQLAEARKRAGMTQREAAEELGHGNPTVVSDYERGTTIPSLRRLVQLAEIYDATFEIGEGVHYESWER